MTYATALITGASSGLGKGLAGWFAARGVKVYAAARRLDALEALAAQFPGRIEPVSMDVSHTAATRDRIEELDKQSGGLDLVIANAGIGGETYAKRMSWPTVERIIDVNVKGAAATLTAALPGMVLRKRGHLVGIASVASFRGLPRSAAYSASKAFLAVFLESLRGDLQGTGVKVSSLHPGFVKSELTAGNKVRMPFLLETDVAVEKMGRAILRGQATFVFPWQMSLFSKVLRALPNKAFDAAARRMR